MDDKKDIKDSYKGQLPPQDRDPYTILVSARNKELFLLKKTEKFVSALHLLTDLIEKDNLFRTRLRQVSLALLSDSCLLALGIAHPESVRSFQGHALELLTILESAYFAGMISEMNFSVFRAEYTCFISLFDETVKAGGSQINLESAFFESPQEYPVPHSIGHYKGQNVSYPRVVFSHKDKKIGTSMPKERKIPKEGSLRSATILSLIKKQESVSVRDVAALIQDVSEKTLQRDLLALAASGVLMKRGERRWSRYSLA